MSDVLLTVPARRIRPPGAAHGGRLRCPADLSIEDIEDLRIAVDELTYTLIGDDPGRARLHLRYTAAPGVVEIEGSSAADGTAFAVSDLSRTIIGGSVTEYEIADEEGVRRFRLVKRTRA